MTPQNTTDLLMAIGWIVGLFALLQTRRLYKENRRLGRENWRVRQDVQRLQRENAELRAPPARKSAEERRLEIWERQLNDVCRDSVSFYTRKVMSRGEFGVFYAALKATKQPLPGGPFPFYVFPQVSLGQIIGAEGNSDWQGGQAHRAINSKRCDLLIADRKGNPIAVLEYQGQAHNIDGTSRLRDDIKRTAVERAGIRFVEFTAATTNLEMQQTIRTVLKDHLPAEPTPSWPT